MATCPKCQREIGDRDRVCVHCGAHVATGQRPASAHRPRPNARPDDRPRTPGTPPSIAPIVILVSVLITVLAALGAWYVLSEPGGPVPTTELPAPQPPDEIPESLDDLQRMAEDRLNQVFGDDEAVGEVRLWAADPAPGLTDVDYARDYHYRRSDCTTLLTDVLQQAALGIAREVARTTAISAEEENRLGRSFAREIANEFGSALDNPADQADIDYVRALGAYLIQNVDRPGIDYTFHVIRDDSFNAFAIPGGHIYVFTGLLDTVENEAQLAGVLAHEIAHVDLRHCIAAHQVLARLPEAQQDETAFIAAQLIAHPFQGRVESEADRRGVTTLYEAGYSTYQVVRLWEDVAAEPQTGKPDDGNGPELDNVYDRAVQEGENLMNDHPAALRRACLIRNDTLSLQQAAPRERLYVGRWNFENRTPYSRQAR